MKIEILGWSSKNLRCADLDFDFMENATTPPSAVLIQMPNGTGKTTTLNCMRAALTGEAERWDVDRVASFGRPNGESTGSFELRLRVDDARLTIGMKFDFNRSAVSYYTSHGRGRAERFNPPPAIRPFLSDHFVRLLVFDGELPHELLDSSKTKAQEALDAFFQLYLLPEVSEAVQSAFDTATEKAGATHGRGLARRKTKVREAKDKIDEILEKRRIAEKALASKTAERDALSARVTAESHATDSLKAEQAELLAKSEFKQREREQSAASFMEAVRRPHWLHPKYRTMLMELRDHLDKLKLPESTSKQFFIELADEDSCVCGRPINGEIRDVILEKAKNYLGTDTYGALNHLKSQIQKLVVDGGEVISTETLAAELKGLDHECSVIETRLKTVNRKIIEQSGGEVQDLQMQIEKLDREIRELEQLTAEIDREPDATDDDDSICLKFWRAEYKKREEQVAEATKTVHLRNCKDIVQKILSDAHAMARERLSAAVIDDMNRAIQRLLPGHNIRARALHQSVELDGQGGASLGQTLAVGYAFLTTLFSRGGHEFPFVVDAPVTALDGRVRTQVAEIIPQVSAQFIAFILDTEKPSFVEVLQKHYGDRMMYLTAFEDSSKNEDLIRMLPADGVKRSTTGIIVNGREYFDRATFKRHVAE